ncbi:DUF3874 domain-containing protein [Parabacteroides faecis]|uniref:BT4734/BF3469 family protein n=1 Tax=Parabacteroides faecis TaxID=1217282 RepID=UPI002164EC27|nr:BT4734/BF3469 family protein [Parabacteroides faecis]MCS2894454.1 DUF3874 domain-containing protein [Parabacteroides faecis]UVQ46957.1 DUF3874 domain-containing protein [Parabacteroides faecis]
MKVTQMKGDGKSLKNIELDAVMATMANEEYSREITLLRESLESIMPGRKNVHADKIPVLLFAAKFRKKENELYFSSYNGVVLVQVNNLADRREVEKIKKLASEAPQTLAAFTGSSGKSVKILVPFTLPDGSLPQTKELAELFHAAACRRTVNYYRGQLQCDIPFENPSLEQGCRFSYDPELYYNPSAIPLTLEQPMQLSSEITYREAVEKNEDPLLRLMPGYERSHIISRLYNACVQDALDKTGGLDEGREVRPFLIRLAENCFHSGIPEEDAVRWTMIYQDLTFFEEEIRETIHTAYQLSRNFGKKFIVPQEQLMAVKTDEFMKRRYEFRRNMLTGEVEFRALGSYYIQFAPITDTVLNSIGLNAQAEGLALWDRDVKRYVYSDRAPVFHPLDDFLDHLPVWDGKDHIRALADTLPTANPDWRDLFYIWFLSMVMHWRRREHLHANSSLPLLVGPQGCGKSTWCRNLLPPSLRLYYTDSIDFGNKRNAELMLSRFALINIDEFDSVSSAYQSFLKHVLQKPVVNARQPYKRSVDALHRYASFIATCNNYDLLSDPTGSRRFICIEITGTIDHSSTVNYEQLYAQASAALASGERYWFTSEEEFSTTKNNEAFQQMPVEEQLLLQYFRPALPDEDSECFSPIEIILYLQKMSGVKLGNKRLSYFGRLLQKNKYPSRRTRRGTCYSVVKIK